MGTSKLVTRTCIPYYRNDFARVARGSADIYGAIAGSNSVPADLWARFRRPR
jgi:hypothetical protein